MRSIQHAAFVAIAASLVLASCGKKDSVQATNASVASVAKQVAATDLKPLPGKWLSTVKIEKMDLSGMPPQAQAMMKQSLGVERQTSSCITPEQANATNGEMFKKANKDCAYDHFSMADGHLDAKLTCNGAGGSRSMTMSGTYSPDHYAMEMSSTGSSPDGMAMNMTMAVTSHRVGECDKAAQP